MIANGRKEGIPLPQALVIADLEWQRIAAEADKEAISNKVYRGEYVDQNGQKRFGVREILLEIYYYKCAYCEIKDFEPDVEHYRPKKRVAGAPNHSGYFWLCYEWSNLIPSCRFCNTGRGKGNKFPVLGPRAIEPSFLPNGNLDKSSCLATSIALISEQPYLLHPEVDMPEQYFSFDRKGAMKGVDSSKRGEKTISICDLNRENLRYRRQKLLDDIVQRIQDNLLLFLAGRRTEAVLKDDLKIIFTKLDSQTQPESEFSLTAIYIRKHFYKMVVVQLQARSIQKRAILNAFQDYLNGVL